MLTSLSCRPPGLQKETDPAAWAMMDIKNADPHAAAVVLLDEADISFSALTTSQIHRHTVIKILNQRGFDYANFLLPFDENSDITSIRGRTIRSNGEITRLQKQQIYEANWDVKGFFYSDIKVKRFTMPAIEQGCIVEVWWTKQVDYITAPQWSFQREIPTLRSRFTLKKNKDWTLKWRNYHIDIEPDLYVLPGSHIQEYTWEAKMIPALQRETAMPPENQQIAHVKFSPVGITQWSQISDWIYKLAEGRIQPTKQIRNKVEEITADAHGPLEKLERIFTYVQSNIRYLAIEIGIGGYQPQHADEVFVQRYGDCKGMVALIVAMAAVVDIPVNMAYLSTWSNGNIDTTLATLSQFNHAIALAALPDGNRIWMDPTEKFIAFGKLPWYDQDRHALIIDKINPRILKTHESSYMENVIRRFWSIDLYEDGQGTGTVELSFHGAQARELREELSDLHPQQITTWFGQELLNLFPVKQYYVIDVNQLEDYNEPLNINSGLISTRLVSRDKDYLSFYPRIFTAFDWVNIFPQTERIYPVHLRYPLRVEDDIILRYPHSWTLITGPGRDSLHTEFGSYVWQIEHEHPGLLTYNRHFEISRNTITPEKYSDFVDYLMQIASGDQNLVLFKEKEDSM